MSASLIGASLPRREDARILRGQTSYVDDLHIAGQAHAAFVRSPVAHARIRAVHLPDRSPGLIAALTAADLAGVRPFPVMAPTGAWVDEAHAHPVLADGEVRYAGQPVALVLAASRAQAEDLAELVEVDYEELDPVGDARRSPIELMRWSSQAGDVDAALAGVAHIVRGSYALPRLAAAPMETRGVLAAPGAGGRLDVWCSAQDVHRPLAQLSHILDRAPGSIHLVVPDVGGAFGSKGVIAPEIAAVAFAAQRLGIAVGWTEDRLENLTGGYQGRGIEGDLELGLDAEGRILALRARLWADLGGYLLTTTPVPPHTAATLIPGCYEIPAAEVSVSGRLTHRTPTGPYRGAGRPDATYMIESLIDSAARQTGFDRVALRRRNLVRRFPHRTVTGLTYDSGDFTGCLDQLLELAEAHPPSRPAVDDADPAVPPLTGSGMALFVERAGGGFESARAQLAAGGIVVIHSSSSPHGQGHDTTFAQIAAERLGLEPGQIELRFGDSDTTPAGLGTFGSRSVSQAGSAVAAAADALGRQARELAAHLLGAEPASVTPTGDGWALGSDPRGVTWAKLAEAAGDPERNPVERAPGPLQADERFASANVFSSGAYRADVAIDPTTGRLTITRLIAVDDAGTIINPRLVHGQVLGGVVQGLGECLTEQVIHDEAQQPRTGSFLDYGLLTAAEIPPIVTGERQTPSPLNPLGAKGAGEGGAIGSLAAVANAVCDALGGCHLDPPFTAEALWGAIQAAAPAVPGPPEPSTRPAGPAGLPDPPRDVPAPASPRARVGATAAAVVGGLVAVGWWWRRRR
jgi:carbon-monoxide dehydrogenase large subunit